MAGRELVVLGTASQAPTRTRNHNGHLLRWDGAGVLFDPGEGTQRQMLLAGVSASDVDAICITHFHGDHTLGLPGVLQRRALDRVERPLDVWYPSAGEEWFRRLRDVLPYKPSFELRAHPIAADGVVGEVAGLQLTARSLLHRVPTLGYRLEEPEGRRILPELLDRYGLAGPPVGVLQRTGAVTVDGRTVRLEQVSEHRPGQVVAFVMDTALCPAAEQLAADADLLVCEATFLERDADLAEAYRHLTAGQAAQLAARARVRRLVLTHLSQRYTTVAGHLAEAQVHVEDVVVPDDLDVVPVPSRRPAG